MTAQKRVIKHECRCNTCEFCWRSIDIFSNCPICGKEVIAKTMIKEVIKEEEGANELD
jgi:predicted Zn-ribbon and HTH transcriptional regulator